MADIKNFGLKGVGSDVQYGKGGGHVSWTGSSFQFSTDGTSLTSIKGAPAQTADQFVTLAQLDAIGSTGLSVKSEAVVVVPNGVSLGTWTSTNGGTYTGTPNVVDGVTLVVGDVVLARYIGVTFGSPIVTTAEATRNGLYKVVSLDTGFGDGVWARSDDSNTDAQVNYNNYVFVSQGVEGGNSFVTSNVTNLDSDLTLNTDPVIWVKFNEAKTYTATNGVKKIGGEFSLSIDSLASTSSVNLSNTIPIGEGTGYGTYDQRVSVATLLNDAHIPYGITTAGLINATGTNTYTTTSLTSFGDGTGYNSGTPVNNGGLVVDSSDATDYKFGLNYNNLPGVSVGAYGGYVGGENKLALLGLSGTHFVSTLDQMMNGIGGVRLPHSIHESNTAVGFVVKTGTETYDLRQLTSSSTNVGIDITGGGYKLGLNIVDTARPTSNVANLADQLIVYSTTDTVNRNIALSDILNLITANQPHNEILAGDSSIIITDDNVSPGSIDFAVDGIAKVSVTNSGLSATSLAATDLQSGRIVVAGANGKLLTDNELLFDVDTNSLTLLGAGTFNSITTTTGGITSGAGVTASGDIVSTGGNITSNNVVTGNTVIGTNGIATGATAGISVGTGGVTSADLTVNKGLVFANSSKLTQDSTFLYDPVSHTLSVQNLSVSGTANVGGIGAVAQSEVTFGAAGGGSLASASNFTYNNAGQLTVAGLVVDGATQSINGSVTNGDIHIVPNGTGEVIIGSSGAGVLTSESGKSMEIHGSTDLTLSSGTGSVFIKDGTNTLAQFNASGTSDTYLVFSGGTAVGGVNIGTSQSADIKFVLGSASLLRVSSASAYEAALGTKGNATVNPDALVTKGYTDKLVSASVEEVIKSAVAVVDLATVGETNIGNVLPANATVIRARVHVITSTADAVTVKVGYTGNIAAYMSDIENDPAAQGVYVSEVYARSTSNIQIIATVAGTPSASSGLVEIMVEYRVPSSTSGI